jgi:hypothetical protein
MMRADPRSRGPNAPESVWRRQKQETGVRRRFWIEQVGMVKERHTEVSGFTIAQVGFADQPFAFELVPFELTKDHPDELDLATA